MPTMRSSNSANSKLKSEINAALASASSGDRAAAIARLAAAAKLHPRSGPLAGVLGKLYFESQDFRAAVRWFRQTTRASPASELASVGLFHSLWKLDRHREAFAEMARFLSLANSDEYVRLLQEMAAAGELTVRRRVRKAA